MFCDKCGTQLREGAKFCQKCGASVSELEKYQNKRQPVQQPQINSQPQKQQVVYQPVYQPQPRPYYAPGTHPYHRLGGFLLFIVVWSYIGGVSSFIGIITNIISYAGILSMSKWMPAGLTAWAVFAMIGSVIISIITGVICISSANQIRSKDSNFLHFIQSSIIAIMIISTVFNFIILIWIKQFDSYGMLRTGTIIASLIVIVVIGVFGLILSSVYFGCSVRVRTYMGSDAYLKQSLFNTTSNPIPADGSDQPGVVENNKAVDFNPEKQWYCTQCGRINSNYVTTCLCGMSKPKGDLSKSWICKKCGNYNTGDLNECSNCGGKKFYESVYPKNEDWICPKCGNRNNNISKSCSVCYTKNPNIKSQPKKKEPVEDEWVCPACGKINANYVGTCGCGQVKT